MRHNSNARQNERNFMKWINQQFVLARHGASRWRKVFWHICGFGWKVLSFMAYERLFEFHVLGLRLVAASERAIVVES